MSETHFDLVVIGSGPAGERGAAQAAYFGKRVALVERNRHYGGAAANTGTLPSKTLRETALFLSGFQQRELYGVDANLREKATIQDLMRRERIVKEAERNRIAGNLGSHQVTVFKGAAHFTDPHTIEVVKDDGTSLALTTDYALIATGSRPWHPPGFPFGEPGIYDSDTILELDHIPGSMIIAGGGVIGCEYACIFATLGIKVTLVESRDMLLSFLDDELSRALKERMISLGIQFRMPGTISSVVPADCDDDSVRWLAALETGESIAADTILIAAGRSGNTESLNLDAVGVTPNKRGQLAVNEFFQTSAPHLYAAGDVVGLPALASTGMEQGRLAMCHAFDQEHDRSITPILPYGVYTIPEVSVAGETEEDALAKGLDIIVGRAFFAANARGQIIGDTSGFLKLIFLRENMKLIGTHVFGESASELVHIGLTAMLAGQGADLFLRTCYNYPTLSETYRYATYDALRRRDKSASAP